MTHSPYTRESDRRRAIVIGGGLAGLLSAWVLARHFQRVDILERDRYPGRPDPRHGLPQARHVHLLLEGGRRILEQFFPGLTLDMIERGACVVDTAEDLATLTYFGWSPRQATGLQMITCTRPLVDWCIRRRLLDVPEIFFHERCRATGLTTDASGSTVTGVRYRDEGEASSSEKSELVGRADLVVDASGRHSRLPTWLAEVGYAPPRETVVDAHLGYATRLYEPPSVFDSEWKALVLLGKPPGETRGGVLLPVEDNRWLVTLAGIGGDYPPQDEHGFLAFAHTLRSGALYDAILHARPLSRIAGNRSTENRLRHYDTLPRWPHHLVTLGDAVCALNPLYAQGMSVAARGALTLNRVLDEATPHSRPSIPAQRFQRELARTNSVPWLMAVGDDMRWPTTDGERPGVIARLLRRYLDGVIALSVDRADVHAAFSRVAHLLDHPKSLLHPRIALRVLASAVMPRTLHRDTAPAPG